MPLLVQSVLQNRTAVRLFLAGQEDPIVAPLNSFSTHSCIKGIETVHRLSSPIHLSSGQTTWAYRLAHPSWATASVAPSSLCGSKDSGDRPVQPSWATASIAFLLPSESTALVYRPSLPTWASVRFSRTGRQSASSELGERHPLSPFLFQDLSARLVSTPSVTAQLFLDGQEAPIASSSPVDSPEQNDSPAQLVR